MGTGPLKTGFMILNILKPGNLTGSNKTNRTGTGLLRTGFKILRNIDILKRESQTGFNSLNALS
jgi:hypothetical protein